MNFQAAHWQEWSINMGLLSWVAEGRLTMLIQPNVLDHTVLKNLKNVNMDFSSLARDENLLYIIYCIDYLSWLPYHHNFGQKVLPCSCH